MKEIFEFYSGDVRLLLDCYPAKEPAGGALIFYAGGGWIDDNRSRFERFAGDLAERGITVLLPQYRVYGTFRVPPAVCMEDARRGLIFAEDILQQYGVAPDDISWGGGSAGAHLVLGCALIEYWRREIPVLPKKMVLFNPVCCPHSLKSWYNDQIRLRFGRGQWERDRQETDDFTGLCPLHDMDVSENLPEIAAFHGTRDEIAPFGDLEVLDEKYRSLGGSCRIFSYPGRKHGFHHPEAGESDYRDSLRRTVEFLSVITRRY